MIGTSKILFTKSSADLILKAFNKRFNYDGIIVDIETGEPILTMEGEYLTRETFGGVHKELGWLKKDILTTIKLSEYNSKTHKAS